MKNEHTDLWGRTLQTTTTKQVNHQLARRTAVDEIGFCCLGLGCKVAGIEIETDPDDDYLRFAQAVSLVPVEFLRWLGFSEDDINLTEPTNYEDSNHHSSARTDEWMLWVDWPEDLVTQGRADREDPPVRFEQDGDIASFDALNDRLDLSFAQIGDVVRYFGVRLS